MRRAAVTGSSGHLGEALVRELRTRGVDHVGIDSRPSDWTRVTADVADVDALISATEGCDVILHTAALHKPQLNSMSAGSFIEVNVAGTQNVIEAATANGVTSLVMTSSTSVFGAALAGNGAAASWITEETVPVPKNIYGVTEAAAEDLCHLAHRGRGLSCVVLRTARFFLEPDDSPDPARGVGDANVKANEYVHRRVALEDVVDAHLCAAEHAPRIGFDRFVISADTALSPDDVELLHRDAAAVLADRHPDVDAVWREIGWRWPRRLDRVYDNSKARDVLGWQPRFGVSEIAELVRLTGSVLTPMADLVGSKEYLSSGYHRGEFGGRGDRSN